MIKRGRYFVEYLKSFSLGNPDITDAWKQLIFEEERDEKTVLAFSVPQKEAGELIIMIEKLLKDKLK